ncbi:beta-ketoacyl synthase, N-terminal domain protein [Mycobacterium xenopi 4042]|uniref:Beta-ketoacyl synthase, N-terminal domain protein n=1 Tax=Mycobacterium xenopi 4042 TaxID=1299334 RepID=X7YM74_MYCXE|nr:beta-ketoacyl synthase, N-terminal domain protein [Mycobacterium xenopi 4042]
MACRFPARGFAGSLWDMVAEGRDVLPSFQRSRLGPGRPVQSRPDVPGSCYTRTGDSSTVSRFRSGFLGVAPSEALAMGPQQRMFLELSWEPWSGRD